MNSRTIWTCIGVLSLIGAFFYLVGLAAPEVDAYMDEALDVQGWIVDDCWYGDVGDTYRGMILVKRWDSVTHSYEAREYYIEPELCDLLSPRDKFDLRGQGCERIPPGSDDSRYSTYVDTTGRLVEVN